MKMCIPMAGLGLLIVALAAPAAAHQVFQISDSPGESHLCRIASDGVANTVVAWVEEADGTVWTRTWYGGELFPAVNHGPGEWPDVAVNGEYGFSLAFGRDGEIVVKENDAELWSEIRVYSQPGAQLTLPRLTGFDTNMWVHGAYLCWQNDLDEVHFAQRYAGDWEDSEFVMSFQGWPGLAMAVAGPPEDPWQARVFVMWEDGPRSSRRSDTGWSAPEAVLPGTMPLGCEYAVGGGGNWPVQILSNGAQPTCPCNVMLHTQELPGVGWTPPTNLTQYYDEYSWPMDPAIAVDMAGRVHALWYQEHYDGMLQPSMEGVFYFVLDDGVWTDETAQLEGHVGKDTDLGLTEDYIPAFVWAEGEDGSREVWMAISPHVIHAPELPAAAPALSAHPNPFNPRTTLRVMLEERADLRVTVTDVSGRVHAVLADGVRGPGEQTLTWNGRDEEGRELPSGIYLVNAATNTGIATEKLVLLR